MLSVIWPLCRARSRAGAQDDGEVSLQSQASNVAGGADHRCADAASARPAASAIEAGVFRLNELFHGHLVDEGIPSGYHYYGAGTHTFPYWARDLRQYVGPLMHRFEHPPRRPPRIGYRTVADPWAQWGWRVAIDRRAPAFSALENAGRGGFVLTGTGRARVRTPPLCAAGERLRVREHGAGAGAGGRLRADRHGRLRLEVPLGTGSAATTTVTIERIARPK